MIAGITSKARPLTPLLLPKLPLGAGRYRNTHQRLAGVGVKPSGDAPQHVEKRLALLRLEGGQRQRVDHDGGRQGYSGRFPCPGRVSRNRCAASVMPDPARHRRSARRVPSAPACWPWSAARPPRARAPAAPSEADDTPVVQCDEHRHGSSAGPCQPPLQGADEQPARGCLNGRPRLLAVIYHP